MSNNLYNILKNFNKLTENTVAPDNSATPAEKLYESVEPQGSILSGVDRVHAKLQKQFAESDFSKMSSAIQKSGKSRASADAITAAAGREKLGLREMTRRAVAGKKKANESVEDNAEPAKKYSKAIMKQYNDWNKGMSWKGDPDKHPNYAMRPKHWQKVSMQGYADDEGVAEEQLGEIGDTPAGRAALGSYIKKAHASGDAARMGSAYTPMGSEEETQARITVQKRAGGIGQAVDRLTKPGMTENHDDWDTPDRMKPTATVEDFFHEVVRLGDGKGRDLLYFAAEEGDEPPHIVKVARQLYKKIAREAGLNPEIGSADNNEVFDLMYSWVEKNYSNSDVAEDTCMECGMLESSCGCKHDMNEGAMSEFDIERQDCNSMSDVKFKSTYKMTKAEWRAKHRDLLKNKVDEDYKHKGKAYGGAAQKDDDEADDEDDTPKKRGAPKKKDSERSSASLPFGGEPDTGKHKLPAHKGKTTRHTASDEPPRGTPERAEWEEKNARKEKRAKKIKESNQQLDRQFRRIMLSENFKQIMGKHHMNMDEMVTRLSHDIQSYKTHGKMSDVLRDCMEIHSHNPQIADESALGLPGSKNISQLNPGALKPPVTPFEKAKSSVASAFDTKDAWEIPVEPDHELNELARLAGLQVADESTHGEYIKQKDLEAEHSGKHTFHAFGQEFNTDEVTEEQLDEITPDEMAQAEWMKNYSNREALGHVQTINNIEQRNQISRKADLDYQTQQNLSRAVRSYTDAVRDIEHKRLMGVGAGGAAAGRAAGEPTNVSNKMGQQITDIIQKAQNGQMDANQAIAFVNKQTQQLTGKPVPGAKVTPATITAPQQPVQPVANENSPLAGQYGHSSNLDEGGMHIGDTVECPNGVTGVIVADLGSKWLIKDLHAETEDDELEFNKSDCYEVENEDTALNGEIEKTTGADEVEFSLGEMVRLAGIAVEGRDYGDVKIAKPALFDNSPEEKYMDTGVLTKGGDGEVAGKEKRMQPNKPTFKNGDNPLSPTPVKEQSDPLEALGRNLLRAYNSIKLKK